MNDRWDAALRQVTALTGVRGALIVSADDGLVVAEAAMEDVAVDDVAALAAALVGRVERSAATCGEGGARTFHLLASSGALLGVAGPEPLWLIALANRDVELGRLRLLLHDFAGALT